MARLQPIESRLERRKARTVAAILDAAERHFLERGYESAKVDEIAADADVAVGSIYNHFGNKDGLYGALVHRALEVFLSYMEEPQGERTAIGHLYRESAAGGVLGELLIDLEVDSSGGR